MSETLFYWTKLNLFHYLRWRGLKKYFIVIQITTMLGKSCKSITKLERILDRADIISGFIIASDRVGTRSSFITVSLVLNRIFLNSSSDKIRQWIAAQPRNKDPALRVQQVNRNKTRQFPRALQRNSIYVFPKKELRGLSPNFHIHSSVSDLYIPNIGQPIFLQQNRQTDPGNI